VLARTDFKFKYAGSVLGYFWSVAKPMLYFTVL
jgi:ABC-type polysaccharide/polyol phosphate export permease